MNLFRKFGDFINTLMLALAALIVASPVHAALPASVETAFDTLETDGLALQAMIWIPLVAITVGFIYMKLFKKGANKAT